MSSIFDTYSDFLKITFSSCLLAVLSACGGGGGSGGGSAEPSDTGQFSTVASSRVIAAGEDCPTGGIAIDSGIDENGNGVLDNNEIDNSEIVCNGIDGTDGTNGTDGLNALVTQSVETAGTNCTFGGIRFDVGIDNNPTNGVLDLTEITSTEYICEAQIQLSDNARLDELQLSAGELDQRFQSSQLSYTATVNYLVSEISITAFSEDENATLAINGTAATGGQPIESIALSEGSNNIVIDVTAEDATSTRTYSLSITRQSLQTFAERARLLASDGDSEDQFGTSVSLDGDTLAVGATADDEKGSNSGSVYVFIRNNGLWREQARLNASDGAADDLFGNSVSISGNSLAIGAHRDDDKGTDSGSAYVFIRSNGVWSQQTKLTAPNGAAGDEFGHSVSLSGDSLAIGAHLDDEDSITPSSGSVYIFTRSAGVWSQQARLTASDIGGGDQFGSSVSLSVSSFGDRLAVGAVGGDGVNFTNAGSVYMFIRSGGLLWNEQEKLTASDGETGDSFGGSVSLSGDSLAVGAPLDDVTGTNSGSVYVFDRSGSAWIQQPKLTASDSAFGDNFGGSVALSGDILAVGSAGDDGGVGSTYVFNRNGGAWTEQTRLRASDAGSLEFFGTSVSMSGDSLAIGARRSGFTSQQNGAVYIQQ